MGGGACVLSGTGSQPASTSRRAVCPLSADFSVLQTDFQMGKPRLKKDQGWHLNKRLCQSRVLGMKQKCRSVGASE